MNNETISNTLIASGENINGRPIVIVEQVDKPERSRLDELVDMSAAAIKLLTGNVHEGNL